MAMADTAVTRTRRPKRRRYQQQDGGTSSKTEVPAARRRGGGTSSKTEAAAAAGDERARCEVYQLRDDVGASEGHQGGEQEQEQKKKLRKSRRRRRRVRAKEGMRIMKTQPTSPQGTQRTTRRQKQKACGAHARKWDLHHRTHAEEDHGVCFCFPSKHEAYTPGICAYRQQQHHDAGVHENLEMQAGRSHRGNGNNKTHITITRTQHNAQTTNNNGQTTQHKQHCCLL